MEIVLCGHVVVITWSWTVQSLPPRVRPLLGFACTDDVAGDPNTCTEIVHVRIMLCPHVARVQEEAEKAFQAWSAKKEQQREKEEAERLAMIKVRAAANASANAKAKATPCHAMSRETAQRSAARRDARNSTLSRLAL